MMHFFSNYALFALKSLTFVFSMLFLCAGLYGLSRKHQKSLVIERLDQHYQDLTKKMYRETGQKKPKRTYAKTRPHRYVIDFKGDLSASQVESLRQEITAVLAIASQKDEVVIRLESPGGTVNGYGLAAAQLQRIRDQNIHLTVCVDQIAASGGYLMACVANRIIAAPFAILGSIGVVAQIPNFHRWLKKNDVDVELHTAGPYKRTLTLFGENTSEGREKFQEDLEKIHGAFKDYILKHRPELHISDVATGEHWLAIDALPLGLVDHLQTSDDYLQQNYEHYQTYQVKAHCPASWHKKLFRPIQTMLQTMMFRSC